ncbi:TetR/AcrR family transcriptional regulator [Paenibacillus sp. sptzw28]|uniref:TetR/AcrR family transcriptional regulator n=1 Tax=Paenibacillus sp. sptzw28 TaxID=715179 RepID=UPI001C6EF7CD|nr:TetR/AcrR family transcriptional regulator [Paenibacillus sp. sptzw28]QYR23470.1 TetR/AcrR family transcriptional regulator [Paenibacillus sp. sptzw28]
MSKRQDIINATLDLIDEIGLQSVTIAQILKKANVGSGTLFNYFSTKEDLVNETYSEARRRMGRSLLANYDSSLSVYERLKHLQLNRLRFGMTFPKEFLFIDSYSYSPYILPELRNLDETGSAAETLSVIIQGQKQGLIKEMDPHLCHQLIHGIVASVVKGYFIQRYPLDELQEQQILEACWKAIKL